jgi:hypothetical protein
MRKRYVYLLLFGIPGLFVAGIISILLFGAVAGLLWLYIFGDNPWPASAEALISILFVVFLLGLWTGFILLGYWLGKRLENDPAVNRTHILISLGLTVLFLLLILLHQWTVGNLGPSSDSALCSEFCTQHGYSGSGLPPEISGERICTCYDNSGSETLRIPLDHLEPGGP